MKIIRGIANFNHQFTGCVLTLGNFDGVHLGHHKLLTRLVEQGKALNLPTVVMIFEPQPLEFFANHNPKLNAPARLTSLREKIIFIEKFGIDFLIIVPFSARFANVSSIDFIEHWLISTLKAQYIIVGDDFRFGAKRQGNLALLNQYAKQFNFQIESMPSLIGQNSRISSTAVRHALQNDDFDLTHNLLGRDYTIQGRVVHGNALARQLGFPTANIRLQRKKPALSGVYIVKIVNLCTKKHYFGVANIGLRPTVQGKHAVLEVHIFDFLDEIYGQTLDVQFIKKLRDEQKFASLDGLKEQIAEDVCIAKAFCAKLIP